MRSKLWIQAALAIMIVSVTLTGCGGKGKGSTKTGMGAGAGQTGGEGGLAPLEGTDIKVGDRGMAMAAGNWTKGEFEPVFFDFDSARVRPSELPKLEAVAKRGKQVSGIMVEGHADERGTGEYNRALGERRALACREELIRLGVPGSRVSTISYGEERPLATGHDEAAWSQNRRCEFGIVP